MFVNLSDIIKKSLIIKGGYKLMSDLINNIIPKPDKELTREHLKKTIEDGCGTDVTIKEANEFYLKTKKKSPKTHSVGARIPSYIYYLLKPRAGAEFDFPISDIIISSLISLLYFAFLPIKTSRKSSIKTLRVGLKPTLRSQSYTNTI